MAKTKKEQQPPQKKRKVPLAEYIAFFISVIVVMVLQQRYDLGFFPFMGIGIALLILLSFLLRQVIKPKE